MALLIRDARVLTMIPGTDTLRGDVLIDAGRIKEVGRVRAPSGAQVIEAAGRVLMPGFVDAHTHALWAGDRLDEFELKRRGASYLDILKSGGGIMSTVRAVRAASQSQLEANLRARLAIMLREGTTTVEVKSGYGLSTPDELKMLRAITAVAGARVPRVAAHAETRASDAASTSVPRVARPPVPNGASRTSTQQPPLATPLPTIIPTALFAHAKDPDRPHFVDETIEETLPAIHAEFPTIAIDAFCEQGAWSLDECRRLFERAIALGHPIRVHADQFNSLGMTRLAIELGALSVDHLEATTPDDLRALAAANTFGVMLPCAGFGTDDRYANGRVFLDAGGKLVIATNCNPGSAPCSSMPFAIALAVRKLNLTAHEAITACTRAAAALLGFTDRGTISPGMRADLILLRHHDERLLAYEFGGDPVDVVILAGEVVRCA